MEDFTLPSVGVRFKKWMLSPSPNFLIIPKNKK
jgi:hypothetical protein